MDVVGLCGHCGADVEDRRIDLPEMIALPRHEGDSLVVLDTVNLPCGCVLRTRNASRMEYGPTLASEVA